MAFKSKNEIKYKRIQEETLSSIQILKYKKEFAKNSNILQFPK